MKLVFMGTPDFAAAHLEALVQDGFDVCGVFTQPDKPRSRMKISYSPVKESAMALGIPVYQPENLRNGTAFQELMTLAPDIIVVVAYGKILPEKFILAAPMGCINVHGSLLPKYRGSAPIQWAILNGDITTGVSTMYMETEVDSGDIIYQQETKIGEFETSGELFSRLCTIGASLLCKTIKDLERGTAPRIPQEVSKVTFTNQLSKYMSPIDWNQSPRAVVKWICGLDPWPVATMILGSETLRVFKANYTDEKTEKAPGSIVFADKRGIGIACADGEVLAVTEIQGQGKKRMDAASYLLGHPIKVS